MNIVYAAKSFRNRGLSLCLLFVIFLFAATRVLGQVSASPGKDGVLTGTATIVNTYYPGTASVTAGTNKSISVGTSVGSATQITKGDLVLIIQMQGADIDATNSNVYGDGTASTPANGNTTTNFTAGTYEYAIATSSISNGAFTVANLVKSYTNTNYSTTTQGQKRFQVVRVPQYSSATFGSAVTITSPAWNGTSGGIVAIDVAGNLSFTNLTIDVTGKGFRGGAGRILKGSGSATGSNTDYRTLSTTPLNGQKGEGTAGTPAYVNNAGALLNTNVEGYLNGSMGRGAPGNAGGGGTDGSTTVNEENSGGGGGANGGTGGTGGNSWRSNLAIGGFGGADYTVAAAARLVLGGGGGAGSTNNGTGNSAADGFASSGAAGGGIVMVRTGSISGSGIINANGANANNQVTNDGSGGGGAGGSVLITAASGLNNITVNAKGGTGGTNTGGGTPHGPGGGGGGGVIYANGTLNTATSVIGGVAGTTKDANNNSIPFGATIGSNGDLIQNVDPATALTNSAAGASSLPVLKVIKTTSTPLVSKAVGVAAEAIYTIEVTSTGGSAQGITIFDNLPANLSYKSGSSTYTYTPASGNSSSPDNGGSGTGGSVTTTTSPSITQAGGATSLSWGTFTIPAGASIRVNFTVTIAAATTNNTTFQNTAASSYLDPTRSTTTRKITPDNIYAANLTYETGPSAGQDVSGSNYASSSSTGEDVTVNAPPVADNKTSSVNRLVTAVSSLSGSDTAPGTITGYRFTSIPSTTQGILYVNGVTATTTTVYTPEQATKLTFDANDSFAGTINLSYVAVDNAGIESAAASYAITVANGAPVATAVTHGTTLLNTAPTTVISGVAGSDDVSISTFRFSTIPTTAQGILYVNNGTSVVAAVANTDYPWAQRNTLTFDPAVGSTADVIFNYAIKDNDGTLSSAVSYTILINGEPVANNQTNTVTLLNSAGSTLLNELNGSDDGTIATFSFSSIPAANQGILYVNGVVADVSTAYPWSGRNQVSFDPDIHSSGNVTFSYVVKDNEGAVDASPATYTVAIKLDTDQDGVDDVTDIDDDNDGISDKLESNDIDPGADADNDGVLNYKDSTPNPSGSKTIVWVDSNNDGINDNFDKDLDGIINAFDLDSDTDGITDAVEANNGFVPSSGNYNASTGRYEGAVGANGLPDIVETSPDSGVRISALTDQDTDGLYDFLDKDADNDGISDNAEAQENRLLPTGLDSDKDGIDDKYDPTCGCGTNGTALVPVDTDTDLVPDYLDIDSDDDGLEDFVEAHDLDDDGDPLNDLLLLAESFRTRAGTTIAKSYYSTSDTDKNGTPDWLEDADADYILNYLDPNSANYHDTDKDGWIDFFDATNYGPNPELTANNSYRVENVLTPLPVTLIDFTAKADNNNVSLKWKTASEHDNDYFSVERSSNGINFSSIGKVKGAGNSNQLQSYVYVDNVPFANVFYYRLKQTDFSGAAEYSPIITVKIKANATNHLLVYPNPTAKDVNLDLSLIQAETVTVEIRDLVGKLIRTKTISGMAGLNSTSFNLDSASSGTYLVIVKGKDMKIIQRIVKN